MAVTLFRRSLDLIATAGTAVVLCGAMLAVPAAAHAQVAAPPSGVQSRPPNDTGTASSLTVDRAVDLAQRNNPDYLDAVTKRRTASAAVRSAYGALMPQLNATLGGQYQQGGQQIVQGSALGASSDILQSQYAIGLSYQLNTGLFAAPRQQRAAAEATESDIAGAREALRATVRQQYLSALQSAARARLQDSLVANAQTQLDLAKARASVGSGTGLDVQRAEVALGQQEVQRLQAQNQFEIDRVRLFQQMGLSYDASVKLVDTFAADANMNVPPLAEVLRLAHTSNPTVNALRARETVARIGVGRQRAEYFPSLTVSTGIGGFTYQYKDPNFLVNQANASLESERLSCVLLQEVRAAARLPNALAACSSLLLTPEQAASIRAANDKFPFNFSKSPRSISAQFSLPLFEGFARDQRRQEAEVQREDARYARRSRELAVEADVTAAYLTLQTAQRTVALQTQNSAKARQELGFVQDQYAVGVSTFVDLTTARATYAQAENDRISALYDAYKAFVALENAVGHSLR